MMAKGSTKLASWALLLPLVYISLLRLSASPPHFWKLRLPGWTPFELWGENDLNLAKTAMARLLSGPALTQLKEKGVACVSDPESEFCVTTGAVRIAAGPARSPIVYLAEGQWLPGGQKSVRPYPRKNDVRAMLRTAPVEIIDGAAAAPPCDVNHAVPAVVFSTGGYAGNFFHDVSELLIPLFLTAGRLRRARFVVTDYEYFWVTKYLRILERLAGAERRTGVVVASSPTSPVEPKVHCFPAAVVGLKYHGNLACNASAEPGGVTIQDFRRFLRGALGLPPRPAPAAAEQRQPVLVLLSRNGSRALLNEAAVAELAREVGFRVEVVTAEQMRRPEGAVLLQVVPWGLDWAAAVYYRRPAEAMGLNYVEYKVAVEESTLSEQYPPGHPVLADPWAVHRLGYNVSGPVFTNGQKLRLNLTRFREPLLEALRRSQPLAGPPAPPPLGFN